MLNRLEAIGDVGRDPEMSYNPQGKAVTKFSLAVNNRRGSAEGERWPEDTVWLDVIAWERLAETCNIICTRAPACMSLAGFRCASTPQRMVTRAQPSS